MVMANRDYQEKRNFIRMRVETPVEISLHNGEELHEGTCVDLSGGGLLVEMQTLLPVGTKLEVNIASSHGHSPMLRAKATVTRIVSQPDSVERPCKLGLEIDEVITD